VRKRRFIRYRASTSTVGLSLNQRNVYAWTEGYKPGATAWAVIVSIVVGLGLISLRNFSDPSALTQDIYLVLGVSLAGGLFLAQIRFEVSIESSDLVFRSRPLFGALLNWPWTERRIPRQSISSFRLGQNAWTEQKTLTIFFDDGSSLGILGQKAFAGFVSFESFVATFRSFFGADSGLRVQDGATVWRLPPQRALVAGVCVACGATMVLAVRELMDQESAMIVILVALMLAVQGVRFLLKSS
jgi:hypothetical protein